MLFIRVCPFRLPHYPLDCFFLVHVCQLLVPAPPKTEHLTREFLGPHDALFCISLHPHSLLLYLIAAPKRELLVIRLLIRLVLNVDSVGARDVFLSDVDPSSSQRCLLLLVTLSLRNLLDLLIAIVDQVFDSAFVDFLLQLSVQIIGIEV